MTARTERKTRHRTTTVTLNPDEWVPIAAWLRRWEQDGSRPGLFIEDEARPGIAQLLRRTRGAGITKDVSLRLGIEDMETLRQQLMFWEGALDELAARFRENAPNPLHFHCMAEDIRAALDETPRIQPPMRCQRCGRPVRGAGSGEVGLTGGGRIHTIIQHPEGDPECGQGEER